jgi:hypothetical protein
LAQSFGAEGLMRDSIAMVEVQGEEMT